MNVWGVTSAVFGYFTSPVYSEIEDSLEPLSLIISLAVAFLLPIKSKPSLINHRVTWDLPLQVTLVPGTTWDLQGPTRGIKKRISSEVADHVLIIKLWPETIELALRLHRPKPSTENNQKRIFLIDFFFNQALKGLNIKVTPTYVQLTDGTVDKLNACVKVIENDNTHALQLEEIEKKHIESEQREKEFIEKNNPLQELKEEKKEASKPHKSEEKSKVEEIKSEEISTKEIDVPLHIKVKNIWEKMCFLETIHAFYEEASLIPEKERSTDPLFTSCIEGIYKILDHHSGKYGQILKNHNKIDINKI